MKGPTKEETNLHTVQDQEILALLCTDPQTGLAALLDNYGAMVHGIVRRVLPQADQDAEECVADVLVAAWQNALRLQRDARSLKGWLCVTARNTAISRWRTLRRRGTVPLDEAIAGDWLLTPQPTEAEERIQVLVLELEEPDRTIFLRRYYLLEPAREIARLLHMTEHNVNVRLSRGREKLRRRFTESEREEPRHA